MATAPRPPQRGSNIDTTQDDSARGYYGNRFCDERLVNPQKLFWGTDANTEAFTTFRLLPAPNPAVPGKFFPGREQADPPQYSGWINRFFAWRGVGNPGETFLLYDADDPVYAGRLHEEIKWEMPAFKLGTAVKVAKKAGIGSMKWVAASEGTKSKSAVLKTPDFMYLAYAAIYERGPDEHRETPLGLDPRKKPILLNLGSDVGRAIVGISNMRKPIHEFATTDEVPLNKIFEVGDPVNAKRGVFFRAFNIESKDPRVLTKQQRQAGLPEPYQGVCLPTDAGKDTGYNTYALKKLGTVTASIEEHTASLWRRLKPMTSVESGGVLKFLSIEEQVRTLARIVNWENRPLLDLFEYAWSERPQWLAMIPDEAWALYRGRVSVAPNPDQAGGTRRDARLAVADEDEEDDAPETPTRGRAPTVDNSAPAGSIDDDEGDEDDEDDAPAQPPARPFKVKPAATNKPKTLPPPPVDAFDEDEDDAPAPPKKPKTKLFTPPAPTAPADDEGDDEDEDDAPAPTKKPKAKPTRAAKYTLPEKDEDEEDKDEDEEDEDEDDDEDDKDEEDAEDKEDAEDAEGAEDAEENEEDEEDEEDAPPPPAKAPKVPKAGLPFDAKPGADSLAKLNAAKVPGTGKPAKTPKTR